MNNSKQRLVAYIRVSTDRQATENDSLEGQKDKITEWAKSNNSEIVKYYIDSGNSAYKGKRVIFNEMITDIEKGNVSTDGIIVYSLSRFSRNELIRMNAEEKLSKFGVFIISVTEPLPEDRDLAQLVKGLIGTVNEHQSRQNSRVVQDRLNDTARSGYFPGGTVIHGYKSIEAVTNSSSIKKKLVILSEEANTIKYIFQLAHRGINGLPMGVKAIAAHLNEMGTTKRGNEWNKGGVDRILNNTAYYGDYQFGKHRTRDGPEQSIIIIKIPGIISEELFQIVQEGLKNRRITNFTYKGESSPMLLTGFLKCGFCKCNLVIQTGKGGRYNYYKCGSQMAKNVNTCKCPIIPQKKLEQIILHHLLNSIITEERILEVVNELKLLLRNLTKEDRQKLLNKQKRSADLKGKINRLYDMISIGELVLEATLCDHLQNLKNSLSIQDLEITELKKRRFLSIKSFGTKQIQRFVDIAKEVLTNNDIEARKAFLKTVITEIIVTPRSAKIEGNNFQLASTVSQTKMGTTNVVPTLVSMWR
ncbi:MULTISPECIES: recombinase family protein [unclassified Colwellia]|uniref:recombinase family protein n=1 Tax=unclassified Colwellia TaxID=196834 RepID=UPI0015F47A15|nr:MULTISPECIES: recombinase family protein [unclassified Colwellia]MBA6357488.1 recombinase family protein [Colwellia sp. BRX8-3]MBA6362046.1 recombinase family protein [Colwellia sp. BRX8-6]MBA6369407.1 recombinase family protein [Colwellia sp. BRX8-5]MBA6376790.1 recombinase family protein [Colwellia sp. BRX8-2]